MNIGGIKFEEGLEDDRIAMTVEGRIEAEGMAELIRRWSWTHRETRRTKE
jgi:hypothetical protein